MHLLKTIVTMINKFKYIILGLLLVVALGFYVPTDASDKKDKLILELVYNILDSKHYKPQEINDEFSEKVYDYFLENLDFNKRFLLEGEVLELEKYKDDLDDQFKQSSLDFFNLAYSEYLGSLTRVKSYYEEILDTTFDFTLDESFESDDKKISFAADENALRDRWRMYLKQRVLNRIEDKMFAIEEAHEKNDTTVKVKSFAVLEREARKKELELHHEWYENMSGLDRIDWLGVYANSFTNIYDPHTEYFPPKRKEDFEISMTGQITGIGAILQQKGDYVTISKVIVGSPCWKQGDLEVGDKIIRVRQEDETNEEAVDLVGMTVRNAVKYIRGEKGTEVTLTVQKLDGQKQDIPIVRDVVEIEATFAKSAVLGEGDEKIGYIRLPKFYVNFYDKKNNRSCSEDIRKELEKLKAENVNGVILDLRNNGGGSLQAVIEMVGLFIDEGPVVQVKSPGRVPQVYRDRARGITYDGPLVVMVNQFSASASEIFAAAIQDYKRGIIIGSNSTYGKGTVQNVIDLDNAVNFSYNDSKPLGALKLTVQKYYRINGGTPQLKGVVPEIILPDNYSYLDFGEKEQEYALPYDEIGSAQYQVWTTGTDKYEAAINNSKERIKRSDKFELIDEYAKWLSDEEESTELSLNYNDFHKEQNKLREETAKYKNMRRSEDSIPVMATAIDVKSYLTDAKKEEAQNWFKNLSRDLYLHEAFLLSKEL